MRKIKMLFVGLAALVCSLAYGQNITVTGVVTDSSTGDPLSGAAILVKGTPQGVVADNDGRYSIVVSPNATLGFTTIGFKDAEVAVNGRTVINVALEPDYELLDDVVVVAYGTASKASLTGAVAAVDSKTIERTISSSVTAALEGSTPGVQVNNSYGEPGSDPSIRIRGFGSVNGSNKPLYVVDGFIFEGNISDLNSNDIESMTVLKDANSAALYGNRAANGVIIITTKRAKTDGTPVVTLSTNHGAYTRAIKEYDRLAPDDWMNVQWLSYKNSVMSNAQQLSEADAAAYASANLIGDVIRRNIYSKPDNQLFDSNGKITASVLPGYTDLDWQKAVEQVGYRREYGVSYASNTDKYNVYSSIGYMNEDGYILNTGFERYTARVNSVFTPVKWFEGGLSVDVSTQKQNYNTNAYSSYYANPFYATRYMAPVYPIYMHNADGSIIYDEAGDPVFDTKSSYLDNRHIIFERLTDYEKNVRNTIDVSAYITFNLPYGFYVSAKANKNLCHRSYQAYGNPEIGDGAANNGRFEQAEHQYDVLNFQQQVGWDHNYGKNHVDALFAHENYSYLYESSRIFNKNMAIKGIYVASNFSETASMPSGSSSSDKTESFLSRVRYNYNQKYFVEASFRRDGSSRFFSETRWGNFWSAGAAWDISGENFMKSVKNIDFLKLRASFGQVGNVGNIDYYAYQALYELDKVGAASALYKLQLSANDLKWETSQTTDIALEGRAFDRVNFSIGWFDKRSNNLLFNVPLPSSAGSYIWGGTNMSQLKNIGSVSNKGWEISADVDVMRNGDFVWNVGGDVTFLKNKIISLPDHGDIANGVQRYSEGHSLYEYYTYHFVGVDQMTGNSLYTIDPEKVESAAANGQLVTINGTDYTTSTTYGLKDWCGTAHPNAYGSFNTTLSWKGLSLYVLATYSLGGKVYDSEYASLMSTSTAGPAANHVDLLNSWNGIPAGITESSSNRINPNGIPVLDNNLSTYNNGGSDRWLIDGSYWILKNITLSYAIPSKVCSKIGIKDLTFNAGVENAFISTARQGLNPQYSFDGGQDATYSSARIFNFGATLKF